MTFDRLDARTEAHLERRKSKKITTPLRSR
jgi:hypothetical protein